MCIRVICMLGAGSWNVDGFGRPVRASPAAGHGGVLRAAVPLTFPPFLTGVNFWQVLNKGPKLRKLYVPAVVHVTVSGMVRDHGQSRAFVWSVHVGAILCDAQVNNQRFNGLVFATFVDFGLRMKDDMTAKSKALRIVREMQYQYSRVPEPVRNLIGVIVSLIPVPKLQAPSG